MAGSSRNSDRRNDNSYPAEKKPRTKTMRERASEAFDAVSRALNPRTYVEPAAQRTMRDANENHGGGARRRRIDAVVDEAASGGRREAPKGRMNIHAKHERIVKKEKR